MQARKLRAVPAAIIEASDKVPGHCLLAVSPGLYIPQCSDHGVRWPRPVRVVDQEFSNDQHPTPPFTPASSLGRSLQMLQDRRCQAEPLRVVLPGSRAACVRLRLSNIDGCRLLSTFSLSSLEATTFPGPPCTAPHTYTTLSPGCCLASARDVFLLFVRCFFPV